MIAVLWRLGEAGVSVFVDPILVDKEVLVDLHNSCKNKQARRISRRTQHVHTHTHTRDMIIFYKGCRIYYGDGEIQILFKHRLI